MSTTTPTVGERPRDDTIRMERRFWSPAIPIAKAWSDIAKAWWQKQTRQMRTGLVVAGLFVLAGTFSLCASLSRPAGLPLAAVAPRAANNAAPLVQEASAPDAGKVWIVKNTWQGTGTRDTEKFTVTGHWRVDWIFSPTSSTSAFQIFVYASDGVTLMQIAASSKGAGGSDTTFWAGPGTYFLRVNSSGGDWKIGVQDLH
jgi:hypothetical protein